jgi:virulence factor Mce-like protein
MKRILLALVVVLASAALLVVATGASSDSPQGTYKIELDNAFGLTTGVDFKVAGVRVGTIKSIDLDQKTLHAVVTVQVTVGGFGSFRSDAFCQSRPQSLIGEYFVDCQPGQYGRVLKPGSTIPVTRTESTIPADLIQNVMRMPYRERLTLIINELGAATAGRSQDLEAALRRAVPALTQTDNLLALLANDAHTLQELTTNSDAVITALANNSAEVQRFITEANNTATATATQQANLQLTLARLPGFLEQLRPTLAQLSAALDANQPVVDNLNTAAGELNRLLTDLPPFSRSALPAIRSLGQASVTGKEAVTAAAPTVEALNQFARPTPELAQNLAIVLHDLDDRGRAVERDSRSPGGKGYTGLEALLQYVFNQTLAINVFGPLGHVLVADAFVDPLCSPYASPGTSAKALAQFGPSYRRCYSWLGPNQQGINEADPSNPGGCVPDPGGAPPGEPGPKTTVCKLRAASVATATDRRSASAAAPRTASAIAASRPAHGSRSARAPSPPRTAAASGTGTGAGSGDGTQVQQLLDYLLAP